MHNWVQGVQGTVQPKFETIVDPDAPPAYKWLRRHLPGRTAGGEVTFAALMGVGVIGLPLAFTGVLGVVLLVAMSIAAFAGAAVDLRYSGRYLVSGLAPRYQGRPITGEGLDRLVDISERFAFARRKIDELPDLIGWDEIEEAVEAIRFDAARHAAALSETEDRWADVRHAPEHSPQAVLRDRLARQRAGQLEILRGYQRTADRLMNHAADAVAAATIAADLGYDLEVALESTAAVAANLRLEAAIQRLDALAEAWRALDASTDLRAAALASEQAQRDDDARANARRLMARLGDVGDEPPTSADGGGSMG